MNPPPKPIEVLLLTQEDCLFCEKADAILTALAHEFPLSIERHSLADPEMRALAERNRILFAPGLFLDGQAFSYGRPSERRLRRELERRSRGPVLPGAA